MFYRMQKDIETCPTTFLPALFLILVERCANEDVFRPGGMVRQIEKAYAARASSEREIVVSKEALPSKRLPHCCYTIGHCRFRKYDDNKIYVCGRGEVS